MSNLAINVRRLRKQHGWSQAELMARSGVTSVKQIERCAIRSPRHQSLESLAVTLGVTVADLYAQPQTGKVG